MKPRTKFQQQVIAMSKKLPHLARAQREWAIKNCVDHTGRRTAKGVITCTMCGHQWQGEGALIESCAECCCPECGVKLKVETTRKEKFSDVVYFGITTTYKGHQVLRYFFVHTRMRVGRIATHDVEEVEQYWLSASGKSALVARLHPHPRTRWSGALEIRDKRAGAVALDQRYMLPGTKIIPELTRRGYRGPLPKLTVFETMDVLLNQPKAETLVKIGLTKLVVNAVHYGRKISDYWPSIRIAVRNGFDFSVPDGRTGMWFDYIDLLKHFGKDVRSPHYVCPPNLKAAHDKWSDKRTAQLDAEDKEKKRLEALQNEEKYRAEKAKFFPLSVVDGDLEVRVIKSVSEMIDEGKKMHHCVATYHDRPNSLILSARIAGKRVETVEFSLKRYEVVQSRGVNNSTTEHHDRIVALVNRKATAIRKFAQAEKTDL